MMKPENTPELSEDARDFTGLKLALGAVALTILIAFLAGYVVALLEGGSPSFVALIILGALVSLIAVIALAMWHSWQTRRREPEARNVKRSRQITYAAIGLGIIIGIAATIGSETPLWFYSDGTISPLAASLGLVVWVVLTPIGTWWWWRSVDEHEKNAYRDGAFIASHIYLFVCGGWWLATKAQWLPPQDPITVFLGFCLIWTIVWGYKKYV